MCFVPDVHVSLSVSCSLSLSLCAVLQVCLCSLCLPPPAFTHDEVQSVSKSRMQDQTSEQSSDIKAHKYTPTPLTDQQNTTLC